MNREYKLSQIAEIVNGSTPASDKTSYYGGDIIWATPNDLSRQKEKYFNTSERTITRLGYESCSTKIIPKNNILLTSRAPIGLIVINTVDCCTNQGFKSLILDKDVCDVEFLYYYLIAHMPEIEALGSGTTFKEVSKASLSEYKVKLPSLEAQKRIGRTLSLLDEKMSLNKSINNSYNDLLEKLYGYWFLQFDFPDKDGKPYRASGGKMVWCDEFKMNIPEGWRVGKIGECIEHIKTGLNPRRNFKLNDGGRIKYITVKNLTLEGKVDFGSCDFITEEARRLVNARSDIRKGDILFASIAPLGRCHLIMNMPSNWEINESVFTIRVNNKMLNSEYLYSYLRSPYFVKKAEHSSTGSIFSGIRKAALEDQSILIPPMEILDRFREIMVPVLDMQDSLWGECEKLADIREFLLPLLMSGKVSAP